MLHTFPPFAAYWYIPKNTQPIYQPSHNTPHPQSTNSSPHYKTTSQQNNDWNSPAAPQTSSKAAAPKKTASFDSHKNISMHILQM